MTKEEAKAKGFTHLCRLYGFKCWANLDTYECEGTTLWNNIWIDLFIGLAIMFGHEGFVFDVIEEL